jgi:hypothetical protein
MVFTFFVSVDEQKVSDCSLKLLANFENPSSNPLERPQSGDLTLKMQTGSLLWFCKIILEAICDKLILAHFSCSQLEVGSKDHRPITEKGILSMDSVNIFQN